MATRDEHRRATLRALGAAAVDLYQLCAPDEPTVEQIAARAGVSRRTVFRYVDAKEDLAFVHPLLWFEIFDRAVAEVADAPVGMRVRHGARAISETIDADPGPVRRAMAVVGSNPSLAARTGVVNRRWVDRIAAELCPADADADSRFRAHVIGAAVMGVIDASLAMWSVDDNAELTELVARGLDELASILPR